MARYRIKEIKTPVLSKNTEAKADFIPETIFEIYYIVEEANIIKNKWTGHIEVKWNSISGKHATLEKAESFVNFWLTEKLF